MQKEFRDSELRRTVDHQQMKEQLKEDKEKRVFSQLAYAKGIDAIPQSPSALMPIKIGPMTTKNTTKFDLNQHMETRKRNQQNKTVMEKKSPADIIAKEE